MGLSAKSCPRDGRPPCSKGLSGEGAALWKSLVGQWLNEARSVSWQQERSVVSQAVWTDAWPVDQGNWLSTFLPNTCQIYFRRCTLCWAAQYKMNTNKLVWVQQNPPKWLELGQLLCELRVWSGLAWRKDACRGPCSSIHCSWGCSQEDMSQALHSSAWWEDERWQAEIETRELNIKRNF